MTKENQITTTNNNGSFLTDKGAFEHTWRVATAFSKSLLVGVLMTKDLFSPFISQSLLFLSFIVATFLPPIIIKIKRN